MGPIVGDIIADAFSGGALGGNRRGGPLDGLPTTIGAKGKPLKVVDVFIYFDVFDERKII